MPYICVTQPKEKKNCLREKILCDFSLLIFSYLREYKQGFVQYQPPGKKFCKVLLDNNNTSYSKEHYHKYWRGTVDVVSLIFTGKGKRRMEPKIKEIDLLVRQGSLIQHSATIMLHWGGTTGGKQLHLLTLGTWHELQKPKCSVCKFVPPSQPTCSGNGFALFILPNHAD